MASATPSAFLRVPSPAPNVSSIDPEVSMRKSRHEGLDREISAVYDIGFPSLRGNDNSWFNDCRRVHRSVGFRLAPECNQANDACSHGQAGRRTHDGDGSHESNQDAAQQEPAGSDQRADGHERGEYPATYSILGPLLEQRLFAHHPSDGRYAGESDQDHLCPQRSDRSDGQNNRAESK